MGTMATESYIHQLNLRTKAHKDQDYYNYTLVNHATVPDRTAYILDNTKQNPLPDLIEDFKQYATLGPDFSLYHVIRRIIFMMSLLKLLMCRSCTCLKKQSLRSKTLSKS